jgi:hypothetical protein
LALEGRVSPHALTAYADVMARNLAASHARLTQRQRSHLWRLLDLRTPTDPAEEALLGEELAALRQALAGLEPEERNLLVAHELGQVNTAELARPSRSTAGAVAARLSRARARLRVAYVLAYTRTTLPSPHCGRVLLALSAGDQRRQAALDTSGHLAECAKCASLTPPLLQRRRSDLVLLPLLLVFEKARSALRAARRHPAHATAGVAAAAGAAAVAAWVAAASGNQPAPPPTIRPAAVAPTSGAATSPLRLAVGNLDVPAAFPGHPLRIILQGRQGQPVRATAVTVEQLAGAVDTYGQADDERFWIGAGPGRHLLVFMHIDREPHTPVSPGQLVSFTGTLRVLPGDPNSLDLQTAAATQAATIGYYIEITAANALQQQPPP